jgi:glycosyltransferase involved in cell wall biosynthesis
VAGERLAAADRKAEGNLFARTMKRHVVVLQYAGDYGEAYRHIRGGGDETYASQAYSLKAVEDLVGPDSEVTSVCCASDRAHVEVLPNRVTSITLGFRDGVDEKQVCALLDRLQPTHLVLRTPLLRVLAYASRTRLPVISTLADSFDQSGFRNWLRNRRLAALLNGPNVLVVGNHGRNACASLQRIGVLPEKVVPWDWPQPPVQAEPKQFPARGLMHVLYAGMIHEDKGVGDLLRAAALLRQAGLRLNVDLLGDGEIEAFRALAARLALADTVTFHGRVSNREVYARMCQSDVVVVPSRHTYPEGLPLTIYEALRSRTPVVASDHPMFRTVLVNRQSARVFEAAEPEQLAAALRDVFTDSSLYERLSRNSKAAWEALQIPTRWGDLIHRWLPPCVPRPSCEAAAVLARD